MKKKFYCLHLLIFLFFILTFPPLLYAKPFKRVLVLSGGGLNPGSSLGIIDGAVAKGWKPDLIISTCGASISSVIYSSNPEINSNLKVLRSENTLRGFQSVEIENSWVWDMKSIFDQAKRFDLYPALFSNLLMHAPQDFSAYLKNDPFPTGPLEPKLLFIGSKALYSPHQVGQKRSKSALFKTVYFTDSVTASFLKNRKNPSYKSYPFTNVSSDTETNSQFTTLKAFRASLADPYLLDPLIDKGTAYFTGAVDLFPIDLAEELGDEVMATYPPGLYSSYEILAINSMFGFNQSIRALQAIQHERVRWIDIYGQEEHSFNPEVNFISLDYKVPSDYSSYLSAVNNQWLFGWKRVHEALAAPANSISHLRKPLNKKLLRDFNCRSAYAWRTDNNEYCEKDSTPGCNRSEEEKCEPLR